MDFETPASNWLRTVDKTPLSFSCSDDSSLSVVVTLDETPRLPPAVNSVSKRCFASAYTIPREAVESSDLFPISTLQRPRSEALY